MRADCSAGRVLREGVDSVNLLNFAWKLARARSSSSRVEDSDILYNYKIMKVFNNLLK